LGKEEIWNRKLKIGGSKGKSKLGQGQVENLVKGKSWT